VASFLCKLGRFSFRKRWFVVVVRTGLLVLAGPGRGLYVPGAAAASGPRPAAGAHPGDPPSVSGS